MQSRKPDAARKLSVSAVVRVVIAKNGNAPVRFSKLWALVQEEAPGLQMSKTHFRNDVLRQMFARGETLKEVVRNSSAGKSKGHWAVRLVANRASKVRVQQLGINWPLASFHPVAAVAAAPEAAAAPAPAQQQ